ncbi:MAG: hypothetical protein U5K69_08750 [Balneolaceae bacterium]|nr:hypothetical protein [Balneolaceae bacterium]
MSESTEKARRVKKENEKNWLSVNGVTAVGVGLIGEGEIGIIISVSEDEQKMRKRFPGR